jgi:hypothetical protein
VSPSLRVAVLSALCSGLALGCSGGLSTGDPGRVDAGFTTLPDGRVVPNDPDGALPPGTCAITRVSTTRVVPTVVVIVDQSGSMTDDFGGSDRWNALRDALLDDAGLIRQLEGNVRFGLSLYTGTEDECPRIRGVDPAMLNFDAIDAMYSAESPLEETPTGDAIEAILDRLLSIPDPDPDPTIFVVATDGEPDTCEVPNPQEGQAEAIAAVERAHESGIRTYMISVGRDVSDAHMQDMANAGLGRGGSDPDAPYWVAGDDEGLRTALRTIISGEVSCTLELAGRIDPALACDGSTVHMSGRAEPLECGEDWRAVDQTHIEILGDTCTEFLESRGATIDARFPCHSILI